MPFCTKCVTRYEVILSSVPHVPFRLAGLKPTHCEADEFWPCGAHHSDIEEITQHGGGELSRGFSLRDNSLTQYLHLSDKDGAACSILDGRQYVRTRRRCL